jgi:asparagine synthase (glutamine-hydrolysing)
MCGIHGFCWQDPDKSTVTRMIRAAHHRGPDGNGTWGNQFITLGHNLLAISDEPSLSTQPWHHEDCVLVFNGEIYNYRELRKELNHPFTTDTDTEVLAVGLKQHGQEFLHKLDGMFALAFYNKTTNKLLLARDSNGTKPLYYCRMGGKLAFSSEIKSLLEIGHPRVVSKEGFKHYYYSGLVAGPMTIFEGILKLIPGEVVSVNLYNEATCKVNLNDRPIQPYDGAVDDIPDILSDKLRQAVRMTLMGRRNIGMFLSGGMDSCSVFYEMAMRLGVRPNTFSTRFELPYEGCGYNDDANLAAMLANDYKANHHEVLVGEQDWVNDLEKAVVALEEPRQGKSYPAYYATNRLLKQHGMVVTLSGDGGDEILAGYKHHRSPPFARKLQALRAGHKPLNNRELGITVGDQNDYLMSWIPKGRLTGDDLNDFLYIECLHTLSEDFLIRNDKLGMSFSMEARFPMMCHVFRDFARSIPGHMKVNDAFMMGDWSVNNKILLRKAYSDRLPEYITTKSKSGWRAPTDDWVIGTNDHPAVETSPIRKYFREVLMDKQIMEIFEITEKDINGRYLNNRVHRGERKPSGKYGSSPGLTSQKELFIVIMFAVWYKKFRMSMW